MRRLIVTMLLASSVAMPSLAQERERGERAYSEMREARSEAREERRSERREARQQAMQRHEQATPRRAFEQQPGERRRWGERRSNNDGLAAAIERQQPAERAREQGRLAEPYREGRHDGHNRDGSVIERAMDRGRTHDGQLVTHHRRGDGIRSRHAGSDHRWNNHWRGSRQFDWRSHRDRHRSVFRRGRYWDPYGSRYRRFSIGFSLFPSYYRSNYWLHDPWMYRLPPAYGPYRWVRYYDDALLVNIYTGRVVDVVHDFFW